MFLVAVLLDTGYEVVKSQMPFKEGVFGTKSWS